MSEREFGEKSDERQTVFVITSEHPSEGVSVYGVYNHFDNMVEGTMNFDNDIISGLISEGTVGTVHQVDIEDKPDRLQVSH